MRRSRPLSLLACTAAAVGLTVPLAFSSSAAPAATGGLSARTVAQIDALAKAKSELTPAQRKVSSDLRFAAAQRSGQAVANGVGRLTTGVKVDKSGATTVRVTGSAKPVAAAVKAAGGTVLRSAGDATDATIALSAVDRLAAAAAVTGVSTLPRAITARAAAPAGAHPAGATPAVGAVTSEGDATLAAAAARSTFHVSGTGITVGVLSDGATSLAASIASGDLPGDTRVLPGQVGDGDEGTAMMEIVHDLAPGAKLLFATAFTSDVSFADNIRALRAAGADIIVDDVIYYNESPFQDGPIAQAVLDVTNDGAAYFSSAGNEGNVTDGTSGNWEGAFVSSGAGIGKYAGVANDFAPGAAVQSLDPLGPGANGTVLTLHWADPLGAAADDYDAYIVNSAGNVVAAANGVQDGNDNPYEVLQIPASGSNSVAVVKYSGANRYLQATTFRGQYVAHDGLTAYVKPGVTRGHSAVKAAYSVAAAPAAGAFDVGEPTGPYPNRYTGQQQSETFTSDGPRRVFFNADGSPITPGNFGNSGGEVRAKPDLTSADGVQTNAPGFDPFYGTSAAAPHAAAVAALVLSGNPGLSPADLRTALTSRALDIEASGRDRDTGYGLTMADRVLNFTGATPQPLIELGGLSVTSTSDGDQYAEAGETVNVTVPAANTGDGTATNVKVKLTSSTSGVTITPAGRNLGAINVGATKPADFVFTVPAGTPAGSALQFTATATFVGAYSPQARSYSLTTGQPTAPATFSYTGAAVPIPDASATGAVVPVAVSGVGAISDVEFSIDGSSCNANVGATTVGIDHSYVSDLVATLTAPDGTSVQLFSGVGGSGNNFCQTVFSDAATTSITSVTSANAPFTGTYKPAAPLSAFDGHGADGTWTFKVADTFASDTGSVRAFSIKLAGYSS